MRIFIAFLVMGTMALAVALIAVVQALVSALPFLVAALVVVLLLRLAAAPRPCRLGGCSFRRSWCPSRRRGLRSSTSMCSARTAPAVSENTITTPEAEEWVNQLFAEAPLPLRTSPGGDAGEQNVPDDDPASPPTERPVELDVEPAAAPVDADAGAKRVGLWLSAAAVLTAVLMILAFAVFGGGPDPAAIPSHRGTPVAEAVSAGSTTSMPSPSPADAAVPFTAATAGCGPGSTSPQALTDTSTDSAWVCTRGPQESLLDGQILHAGFTCDRSRPDSACSYMLTSMSVTPGWVAKTVGGKDQWLAHRVVTRLQFNFFNGNQLAADPFYLDTNGVHGPVTATLPARVLASRVDVLVLHTDRPPAAPLPVGVDGVTATESPSPTETPSDMLGFADPVDATFAMSQLQFFGHAPH
jgi:hypothetical protein